MRCVKVEILSKNFLYPSIRVRIPPPVSVRVRATVRASLSFSFSDRSKEIVIPLYKSLARPHLEHCSQIWSPHYIKLVEGVQRRATKLVQGMEGLHYDDRLKCLNLMRLETRRVRSDLIETFKIVNGKYSINSDSLSLNTMKVEEEII